MRSFFGVVDKSVEDEKRQRVITYKQVFGSQNGRDVLMDLMNRFHILNEHSGDGFSEGQRSVVLYIMKMHNMNLELFDKMCKGEVDGPINSG